jgi:hypothetical protein
MARRSTRKMSFLPSGRADETGDARLHVLGQTIRATRAAVGPEWWDEPIQGEMSVATPFDDIGALRACLQVSCTYFRRC